MAQRFGGKFSPERRGDGRGPGGDKPRNAALSNPVQRVSRAGARVNLLFLVPLFFLARAFFADSAGLFWLVGATAILLMAAWMTREGLVAEDAFEARKIARRPALPRKIIGSVLTGFGLGLAAMADAAGLAVPLGLGLLGAALHLASFGPDPLRDKGMAGIDTHAQDRVARAVSTGEAHLAAMKDAILRARDRTMEARVEAFAETARGMFRAVEDDPRDLTAARKYLGVYLMGARDATIKFADLFAQSRDAAAKTAYLALLDDLEKGFAKQRAELLDDNRADLDIEIDVLRERLEREGIHAE